MAANPDQQTQCWVTLVTKPSYLAGVIILAHSLDKQGSKFPLVVQYTKSLGQNGIIALESEARRTARIIASQIEPLVPREGQQNVGAVAQRFKDTFTKLRAFEVHKLGFTKCCFLDADIAAFQYPDMIFDLQLPGKDWIGANQCCVCNLDYDPWAPLAWNKGNCAYTRLTSPDQTFSIEMNDSRPTYQLINGGMFLFHPSEHLWMDMMHEYDKSEKLKDYQFPDQDFLADFFGGRILMLSWKFNALKTMKYIHPTIWSDESVVFLHYIVDKPWDREISTNGVAGHMGRDGETHGWWWALFYDWLSIPEITTSKTRDYVQTLIKTQEPFDKYIPLSQSPGCFEDSLQKEFEE